MPTSQPRWGREEHSSSFHDHDHIHISAATLRSADVHAPAQRCQLFPHPSQLLCAQTLTHSATVFEDHFPSPKKKKKALELRWLNHMCTFCFFPVLLLVPTSWLQPDSHRKSSLKVWTTLSLHMQNCDSEISVKHLTTSRESSQFSIVNNLNGCLKGWRRRETLAAALCCLQRPAKCAWLCGEKGNNIPKKWWSYCVELLFAWGQFLFSTLSLLESFDSC